MEARRVATGSWRCSDAGSTGASMTTVVVVMEETPTSTSAAAPVLVGGRVMDAGPPGNRVRSEARCSTASTTNTPRYMAKCRTPLLPNRFFRSVFDASDPDRAAEEEEEDDDDDEEEEEEEEEEAAAASMSPPVAPGIMPP